LRSVQKQNRLSSFLPARSPPFGILFAFARILSTRALVQQRDESFEREPRGLSVGTEISSIQSLASRFFFPFNYMKSARFFREATSQRATFPFLVRPYIVFLQEIAIAYSSKPAPPERPYAALEEKVFFFPVGQPFFPICVFVVGKILRNLRRPD